MGESMNRLLRNVPSNVIATYDYYDIAEGTGIKTFTGFIDETASSAFFAGANASHAYLISDGEINISKRLTTWYSIVNSSALWTKFVNVDFDLGKFNIPKIIKGTGYFQGTWTIEGSGSNLYCSSALIIKIKKVDLNNNETIYAVVSGALIYAASTSVSRFEQMAFNIPQINFKKGENLRISGEIWSAIHWSGTSGTGLTFRLYHDPSKTPQSGAFIVKIPFKLDI